VFVSFARHHSSEELEVAVNNTEIVQRLKCLQHIVRMKAHSNKQSQTLLGISFAASAPL
jgi:hypothetical protein